MTRPTPHPAWCSREHGDDLPMHEAEIGARLDLSSGSSYAVHLQQVYELPAKVLLTRNAGVVTTVTGLSIVESAILRDLLTEALTLLAEEVGR